MSAVTLDPRTDRNEDRNLETKDPNCLKQWVLQVHPPAVGPLAVVVKLHQNWNSPLREPECSGKNFFQVRKEKMAGQSTRYINTGFFRTQGLAPA